MRRELSRLGEVVQVRFRQRPNWLGWILSAGIALVAVSGSASEPAPSPDRAAPAWLTLEQEKLLQRSFVRCYLERHRSPRFKVSERDAYNAYVRELDAMSLTLTTTDIARAPTESVSGQMFIACRWFVPSASTPARQ